MFARACRIPDASRRPAFIAALLATLFCFVPNAFAFKLKSHIMIVNQAASQVNGPPELPAQAMVSFSSLGAVRVHNPDVVRAIQGNMGAYRAGALGPDIFPDLYGGQVWVHVNNGNIKGLSREACQLPDCVPSDVSFEARAPISKWRSIDYGMFLLKRAHAYNDEGQKGRDKAIAFAHGYLAHMAGDGFAHSYVNEWVRSVFDYKTGHSGALYGPLTEEIQHLAVEGFIDAHIPKMDAESLRLDPPLGFLNKLFQDAHGHAQGLSNGTRAGAFGGAYFETLLDAKAKLLPLSKESTWDPTGKFGQAVRGFATLGTGIGDPVVDVSSYFRQRYEIIDAALEGWTRLSGCIAQNLVNGANQGPGEVLDKDACATLDFEQKPAFASLFRGDLNKAARLGQFDAHPDFGRTAANMAKQREFVTTVLNRAFIFNPTEDIASLKKIKDTFAECKGRLIEWDSCDNACTKARSNCTTWVTKQVCRVCPDCTGSWWEKAKCVAARALNPHCLLCDVGAAEPVVDAVCASHVAAAAPVCHVCSENPVCRSLNQVRQADEQFALFTKKVILEVIDPLVERVKDDLLQYYAGPYAKEMYDLYQVFEKRRSNSGPAWFVNLAFLREDFRREPAFLNDVVGKMVKTGPVLVDNGVSVADAIASTFEKTKGAGSSALQAVAFPTNGGSYESIWRSMVDGIVSIARDGGFNAAADMGSVRFAGLDQFQLKESDDVYQTRFARFAALLNALGALTDLRGPTARALRASMSLENGVRDTTAGTAFFSPYSFEPVQNAIQLTKLGFLSNAGLAELGTLAGMVSQSGQPFGFNREAFRSLGSNYEPSRICGEMGHVLCDSIQSLDDPNHYGVRISPSSHLVGGTDIDGNRSVALMQSLTDAQNAGGCLPGLSNFLLSGTPQSISKLYEKIFVMPIRCASDLVVDFVPTFDGVPVSTAPGAIGRASPGQVINMKVRVRNLGGTPSLSTSARMSISNQMFFDFTVPTLNPHAQVVFDAVFPAQFGSYQAIAEVDHVQRIAETQETNNSASFTFHVH